MKTGLIQHALSGFYYVDVEGETYVTKPRGNFRHQQLKPLVGDRVVIEVDSKDVTSEGRLVEILPRKNTLIRPTIANVDEAFVVFSLIEPDFSYHLLDYFLVNIESYDIHATIVLTKYDRLVELKGETAAETLVAEIKQTYQISQYDVIVKQADDTFKQAFIKAVPEGICLIVGQSGVGKSTLLNQLLPQEEIPTNEISSSLNRGKHTTRDVKLYPVGKGLLADTPGFSSIDFQTLEKEEISDLFPDICLTSSDCRFRGCLHINEPGCAVKESVVHGNISQTRYDSYVSIIDKIESRKPVYRKKEKT